MKRLIKQLFSRLAPGPYQTVSAIRARRHGARMEGEWGYVELARRVLRSHGPVVSSGPFRGLTFTPRTFERHISPKLFGSYEAALIPVWERVLARPYQQVLDIGCADGYFAVGIARRLPEARVHAFDTDPWARSTTREMSAANGTTNLEIHGACTPELLSGLLRSGAFILSDCEGYEDHLFQPELVPPLRRTDLLIELHENVAPGVTVRLLARFEGTHDAEIIADRPREPADYPASAFLGEADGLRAIHEVRTDGLRWLLLTARNR